MTKSLGQIAYEFLTGSPAASWEGVDAWHRALYESCAQAVAVHVRAEDAKQAAIPQWQDIATAPKDETPVYLWADGECMPNMVRVDLGDGNVFYDAIKSGYLSISTATHWMSVPPPPPPRAEPDAQRFYKTLTEADLPIHPEPMSYCWSDLEKRAILKWANNLTLKNIP